MQRLIAIGLAFYSFFPPGFAATVIYYLRRIFVVANETENTGTT